jgi:hypothetical protein
VKMHGLKRPFGTIWDNFHLPVSRRGGSRFEYTAL